MQPVHPARQDELLLPAAESSGSDRLRVDSRSKRWQWPIAIYVTWCVCRSRHTQDRLPLSGGGFENAPRFLESSAGVWSGMNVFRWAPFALRGSYLTGMSRLNFET